jgi:hypothetical protein
VVAGILWLLTVRPALPRAASIAVTSAALLGLAALQGFIRPDVIFAVYLGVFLVCMTPAGDGFSLGRWIQAAVSILAVLIAAGIQFYLMHVVYPHAEYGRTPVIQLGLNLTGALRWPPFVLFMLPWMWLLVTLARRRFSAEAPGLALLIASAIYLVLWLAVGSMEEVRIFMPFATALIPLTCACAMRRFLPASLPLDRQ